MPYFGYKILNSIVMKNNVTILFILFACSLGFSQNTTNLDSIANINLPSLSSLSSHSANLVSRKLNTDFSKVKVNTNYRDIKEGHFVMSKDAFVNYNQFDYRVFNYTSEDALRRITPNYDLMSAPLPSPTYYSME